MDDRPFSSSLRLSSTLLVGQLPYIVGTEFHTGGEANNHPAIFAAYASSGIWAAVHIGQFAAMAIILAGWNLTLMIPRKDLMPSMKERTRSVNQIRRAAALLGRRGAWICATAIRAHHWRGADDCATLLARRGS